MINSRPLTVAPEWLLDLNEKGRRTSANDNHPPVGILREGSRNVSLTSFAGSLVRTQNINEKDLAQALISFNSNAKNPLGTDEVLGIARSVSGYGGSYTPAFQDIPLSRYIAASIVNQCRYAAEWGWLAWEGTKWVPDLDGNRAREAIKKQLEAIYEGARSQGDPESTSKARNLLASGKVTAMLTLIQSDDRLRSSASELDAIEGVINLKNGTLNLTTSNLCTHQHEDLLSKVANAEYDPDAECPTFDMLLESTLPIEHRRFILRLFGYMMLGHPREQIFVVFTGKGANGKSTLLNAVAHVLGDYSANVEPSSFIRQKSERVRNDLARLKGARLVGTSELAIGEVLDASLVKRFTGGDPITARALYKEYFEFQAEFVVVMATNAMPVIDGGDSAMARRLVIVPFQIVVPENERDPELPRKLREEASGILNRLLDGMREYKGTGLCVPDDLKKEAARFCLSSDMLGTFLDEKCELGPKFLVGSAEIYRSYKRWCESNGLRHMSINQFKQELIKRLGFSTKKTRTGAHWPGLRLLQTRAF